MEEDPEEMVEDTAVEVGVLEEVAEVVGDLEEMDLGAVVEDSEEVKYIEN